MPAHRDLIVEQFTKQAVPFSTAPGVRDEEALRLLVDFTGAGPEDSVLDVACGPGLVVCALAPVVRHATGIDVTPAMIERARALAAEKGLGNVAWRVGDALPLPYPDGAFSLVVSRFAFHHFPAPRATFYQLRSELEGLLERSFPEPGDAERIRGMFVDSLADDGLGLGTRRHGDAIVFAYPVAVLVAIKTGSAAGDEGPVPV